MKINLAGRLKAANDLMAFDKEKEYFMCKCAYVSVTTTLLLLRTDSEKKWVPEERFEQRVVRSSL